MISDKKGIQQLAAVLLKNGVTDIVISPGSRNAPVINTFAGSKQFNCYSVVDERSAAFFALGMAIRSGKTVALNCTSGTAALNYAPAVAEAFYQKVPLLILTADRPVEWTDQADGQTIRQRNLYSNHIRKSVEIPQRIHTADDLWHTNRLINEAVNACRYPVPGPVHINLPFAEPLYNTEESHLPEVRLISQHSGAHILGADQKTLFTDIFNRSRKIMLLAGQDVKNGSEDLLNEIAELPQVIMLTESTSNIANPNGIGCIDKVLATIGEDEEDDFAPDLLLTFGEAIVSKRIKAFLRRHRIQHHIHINVGTYHADTYQQLSHSVFMETLPFFHQLMPGLNATDSDYHNRWISKRKLAEKRHNSFLKNAGYSDLKVFEEIFNQLPEGSDLHLGNSSPVRYAQLFRHNRSVEHFSNRGTSGIDGSTSTAVGAAWAGKKLTVLITGDLSFIYDSNGLWNPYLSYKLRIIVINNGGGNIFRIIPGPSGTDHLEEFYETKHLESTEGFAKIFGLEYFHACNMEELSKNLEKFFNTELRKPALLEVLTNRKKSPDMLKNYFAFLKDGKLTKE